ncbi:probable G-protein coupled receptor 150 [Erpetoichthys calabaricus]|uniref:probable G-protein coupled receptor 150 n=1 Tax=Erpetoichthys calabaricus TaxID=27687 RepID=UPI00109EFBBC|nr:probable G-protein coupled receptor 150 [Erpetoichthys calabaricus]
MNAPMEVLSSLSSSGHTNVSTLVANWNLSTHILKGNVTEMPVYNRRIRIISLTVIFAIALVGNSTVLHKICCGKSKKRKIDFLITNLALADVCVSVMTLLSQIIWEVLEDEWLAGDLACRVFKIFQVFGLIASSNIIAIIALERHHVIVHPLESPLPAKLLASLGWLAALLLSIPQAFVFKVIQAKDKAKCLSVFANLPTWHFQVYIIYGSITAFFLPFCILCVAYTRILWTIWRKEQPVEIGYEESRCADPKYLRRPVKITATNSSIPRAKIKTLKMTLVIIILFIICGLPYFIIEMKVAFGSSTHLDEVVTAVLGIFVVTNSAVNPYVYLFFKTNNVLLRKVEKNLCFSCLKDYRENTFHRELLAYPWRKVEQSAGATSSDTDTSTLPSMSCSKPTGSLSDINSCDSST